MFVLLVKDLSTNKGVRVQLNQRALQSSILGCVFEDEPSDEGSFVIDNWGLSDIWYVIKLEYAWQIGVINLYGTY